MERSPLYYQQSKKFNVLDLFRNYQCPYYDLCLEKAAYEDLFLDCTACFLKDTTVEIYLLDRY